MRFPILDIDNWKEINATLGRNKTRTFLTAFGIFWGTAILAILWGASNGFEALLRSQFEGFATNMGIVWANRTSIPYQGLEKGRRWDITTGDIEAIKRVNGIEYVVPNVSRWNSVAQYGTKHTTIRGKGTTPEYERLVEPIIISGRFINNADISAARKVCTIGKRVATELFGSEDPVGKNVSIDGIYYKIVGVVTDRTENMNLNGRLDESAVIPLPVAMLSMNRGDKIDMIAYTAHQGVNVADVQTDINRILQRNHILSADDRKAVAFMDVSSMFAMVDNLFAGVTILALFVGLGTLLAGIIGVGNIMWVIVKERTHEIGIRRAIGAKPRDIMLQILMEGMVMTLIAGLAGICLATLVLGVAQAAGIGPGGSEVPFQMKFHHAVIIMAVFTLLGTSAGIIPSLKALRIKPVEAINDK